MTARHVNVCGSACNSGKCYNSCCANCHCYRWIPQHTRRRLDEQYAYMYLL